MKGAFSYTGNFYTIDGLTKQTNTSKIVIFKNIPDYVKIVATEDDNGTSCTCTAQLLNGA